MSCLVLETGGFIEMVCVCMCVCACVCVHVCVTVLVSFPDCREQGASHFHWTLAVPSKMPSNYQFINVENAP